MYAVAVGTVGILVALFLFFPPGTAVVTALSIFAIEVMTVPFVVLGGTSHDSNREQWRTAHGPHASSSPRSAIPL